MFKTKEGLGGASKGLFHSQITRVSSFLYESQVLSMYSEKNKQ